MKETINKLTKDFINEFGLVLIIVAILTLLLGRVTGGLFFLGWLTGCALAGFRKKS